MATKKNRYKGIFSFSREIHIRYLYAHSERQAFILMCRHIAKVHGVTPTMVINHFSNSENIYEITPLTAAEGEAQARSAAEALTTA